MRGRWGCLKYFVSDWVRLTIYWAFWLLSSPYFNIEKMLFLWRNITRRKKLDCLIASSNSTFEISTKHCYGTKEHWNGWKRFISNILWTIVESDPVMLLVVYFLWPGLAALSHIHYEIFWRASCRRILCIQCSIVHHRTYLPGILAHCFDDDARCEETAASDAVV